MYLYQGGGGTRLKKHAGQLLRTQPKGELAKEKERVLESIGGGKGRKKMKHPVSYQKRRHCARRFGKGGKKGKTHAPTTGSKKRKGEKGKGPPNFERKSPNWRGGIRLITGKKKNKKRGGKF